MEWESFMVDLILTLTPVLATILAYVLIALARFVIGQTNNDIIKAAVTNLEQIILATVTALSQTLVDDLKQNRANNKLTDEEAALIKDKAMSSIKKQMGIKDMDILQKNFGSVDDLIDNILEQKVMENKLRRGQY
ncbi:MAG: hypothetical protein JM58_15760 [Peptococcaceae bacterium BICA1-8]|nr:MAG: hypothetical protein JM58_15760 [Peptococcaceae bacterium BICA1-8]